MARFPFTTSDANDRAAIATAMRKYHAETCIKFVPRSNHRDYIHIYRGGGWV